MNLKKLNVTEARKPVIIDAVTKAMNLQPEHMRDIYGSILSSLNTLSGKTLLIPAQVGILVHSLKTCGDGSPECQAILDQMTMTRREYHAKHPETVPAF